MAICVQNYELLLGTSLYLHFLDSPPHRICQTVSLKSLSILSGCLFKRSLQDPILFRPWLYIMEYLLRVCQHEYNIWILYSTWLVTPSPGPILMYVQEIVSQDYFLCQVRDCIFTIYKYKVDCDFHQVQVSPCFHCWYFEVYFYISHVLIFSVNLKKKPAIK